MSHTLSEGQWWLLVLLLVILGWTARVWRYWKLERSSQQSWNRGGDHLVNDRHEMGDRFDAKGVVPAWRQFMHGEIRGLFWAIALVGIGIVYLYSDASTTVRPEERGALVLYWSFIVAGVPGLLVCPTLIVLAREKVRQYEERTLRELGSK